MKAFIFLFACGIASVGWSQEDGGIYDPGSTPRFNFTNISVARVLSDENGESIVSLRTPKYRPATEEKTFNITRMIPEERIRVVIVDGKPVEQTFTVFVPVVETVSRVVSYLEPNGMVEMEIPIDAIEARDIDGRLLSNEDLLERLEMQTHVIRLDAPWNEENPIGTYYLSILARSTIFVYIDDSE